jgi:hypothetical protein
VFRYLYPDTEENLALLRETIRRVAKELNKLDWRHYCNPTDDFVVFPADGSHTYYDDFGDMKASVPAKTIRLLRSKGLIGPESNWEQLPDPQAEAAAEARKRQFEAFMSGIRAKPKAEQIQFWIDQLNLLSSGKRNSISENGCNDHLGLGALKEIGGKDVVIALLHLAAKFAKKYEWTPEDATEDNAERLPSQDPMIHLMWTVAEMGFANKDTEVLLRDILKKSCQVNDGKEMWGLLPVHCAGTLHKLFSKRYPDSEIAGNNALNNRLDFLSVPLK